MRGGLIIGFACSILFNIGAFGGFAMAFKPIRNAVKEDTKVVEVIFEQEQITPPEPPKEELTEEPTNANEAPQEAIASLPEPPPAMVMDNSITEVFKPTPPVPPRPDAFTKDFTSGRKGGTGGTGTGAGIAGNLVKIFDLDRQPQTRVRPTPTFPFDLRRQGVSGNASVRIYVDEQGVVYEAEILRATHPEFGRAAREAAMKIRMTPGTKNGKAVRFVFDAPYVFNLGNDK